MGSSKGSSIKTETLQKNWDNGIGEGGKRGLIKNPGGKGKGRGGVCKKNHISSRIPKCCLRSVLCSGQKKKKEKTQEGGGTKKKKKKKKTQKTPPKNPQKKKQKKNIKRAHQSVSSEGVVGDYWA